jgi:hypothetical protein
MNAMLQPDTHPYVVDALELAGIRLDGGTQPRVAYDDNTVLFLCHQIQASYDRGGGLPPIVVFFDGRDHWLADGFYRVKAAMRANRTALPAKIHPGTQRDAILYSCAANLRGGKPRANADKARAVDTLLHDPEWRKWSNMRIAEHCGVYRGSVAKRAALLGIPRAIEQRPAPQPPKTGKRKAVEIALRRDPLATGRAIASAAGCSTELVRDVRLALGIAPPPNRHGASPKARSAQLDKTVLSIETHAEMLAALDLAPMAGDPRCAQWVNRLNNTIGLVRKVRNALQAASGRTA